MFLLCGGKVCSFCVMTRCVVLLCGGTVCFCCVFLLYGVTVGFCCVLGRCVSVVWLDDVFLLYDIAGTCLCYRLALLLKLY